MKLKTALVGLAALVAVGSSACGSGAERKEEPQQQKYESVPAPLEALYRVWEMYQHPDRFY